MKSCIGLYVGLLVSFLVSWFLGYCLYRFVLGLLVYWSIGLLVIGLVGISHIIWQIYCMDSYH